MNILAIDPGTSTGWATLIYGSIRSGVTNMKGKANSSAGMKYLKFDAWVAEMDALGRFDVIYYEKPHHMPGNAIESMNGFITGIHRYVARVDRTINYQAVSPGTIKLFATGHGNADKAAMIAWFRGRAGHEPLSDDEADAYALLLYAMNELGVTTNET